MADESDGTNEPTYGDSKEQQLMKAAKDGNLGRFDDLAEQCGDWLKEKDAEEKTVLMHAACGGAFRDILAKVPKKKVRKQLLATDRHARSILTHAIISAPTDAGNAERVKSAIACAREHLSAEEVLWLLGRTRTGKVANPHLAVKVPGAALAPRRTGVGAQQAAQEDDSVQKAVQENVADLEKEDSIDKRTSTLQSKILKFVPAEMIIVFQVLLGQVDDNESHAFILLVLMTVVSPVVTWAANQLARDDVPGVLAQLKTRQKPTSSEDPKHSWVTILLAAPAFFFWALGTSTVGQGFMGWSEGVCNAFFTVANIVIPGVDAFCEAMATRWDMGAEVAAVEISERAPPFEV